MKSKKTMDKLYEGVIAANTGITKNDIKSIFIWYILFSCTLSFQIIFILIYSLGSRNYAFTMCSVFFICLMDAIIKNALERDGKNYQIFKKHISLIKLWVIPLVIMGIVTTVILIGTTFGLI